MPLNLFCAILAPSLRPQQAARTSHCLKTEPPSATSSLFWRACLVSFLLRLSRPDPLDPATHPRDPVILSIPAPVCPYILAPTGHGCHLVVGRENSSPHPKQQNPLHLKKYHLLGRAFGRAFAPYRELSVLWQGAPRFFGPSLYWYAPRTPTCSSPAPTEHS